jgi:hypothetical protein
VPRQYQARHQTDKPAVKRVVTAIPAIQQPVGGHTLQVISIIDNRLLMIEKKLKEDPVSRSVDNNSDLSELQNEYEERFDMILREIDSIKEIVIKLQAYTMDVNKILVEEHTANKIILERRRSFTTRFLNRWITRTRH